MHEWQVRDVVREASVVDESLEYRENHRPHARFDHRILKCLLEVQPNGHLKEWQNTQRRVVLGRVEEIMLVGMLNLKRELLQKCHIKVPILRCQMYLVLSLLFLELGHELTLVGRYFDMLNIDGSV